MFSISMQGDQQLIMRMNSMPATLRGALYNKCLMLSEMLHNYIITNKLSGQVLNHKTGALWRSIRHGAEQSDTRVIGRVWSSGVKYAAIHEFGGYIPPHVIEAKNAKSLAFMMGGQMRFFKRVNWPGATMPERSYMRSALRDKKSEIVLGLKETVMGALNGNS